jgi:broad specificity phosphatase PhoE
VSSPGRADHVLLLRHGATAQSASGRFTGRIDVPLSEEGRTQAEAWSPVLAARVGAAVTSPLARTRATAEAAGLDAQPDPLWLEWDLGSLDGRHADQFRAENPGWNLFRDGAPDGSGESPDEARERARDAWAHLVGSSDGLVVAVSHGQYLRLVLSQVLGAEPALAAGFSLGPARAGLLSRRGSRYSLTGWNLSAAPARTSLLAELT